MIKILLELSDGKGGNVLETVAEDEELLELETKDGTGTGVVGNNAAENMNIFIWFFYAKSKYFSFSTCCLLIKYTFPGLVEKFR